MAEQVVNLKKMDVPWASVLPYHGLRYFAAGENENVSKPRRILCTRGPHAAHTWDSRFPAAKNEPGEALLMIDSHFGSIVHF